MRKLHWVIIGLLVAALAGCGSTIEHSSSGGGGITSDPSGAAIAVNGQATGKVTPADIDSYLSAGENLVTLTRTGYNPWSTVAVVTEGTTLTLQATLTPSSAQPGTLTVQSVPAGATVVLDGNTTDYTTPATIPNVSASQHVVGYNFSGFYPFREDVTVAPGGAATSSPTLTRLGQGRITGRVLDDTGNGIVGAQVGVRGQDVSTTTSAFGVYVLPNVPNGTYTLDAAMSTGGTALRGSRENVEVDAGTTAANVDILTAVDGAAGGISGVVKNSAGRAIEGAEIFASVAVSPSFQPDSTVAPYRATTDSSGHYALGSVPPGYWVLTAAYPDYATVTKGISPQVYLAANASLTVNFELPASSASKPAAPQSLSALAFTFPTVMSRSPAGYATVRDLLLRRAWGSRFERVRTQRSALKTRTRTAPDGSVIEVDLSWTAAGDPDIIGYYIGRSTQENTGYQLIEDLLNPHAGLWIDYDARLSPDTDFFYRVTAVNTRGVNSDPSNTGRARPLGQITVNGPDGTAASATPTFDWDALQGAFAYDVQLFDHFPEQFVSPLWEAESIPASHSSVTYDGPALSHGQTYYWVVAGRDSTDPETIHGWSISRITPFTVP